MAGTSDILMLLVQSGSSGIQAESLTALAPSDKLLIGTGPYPSFEQHKFFELDSFSMNLAAQPSDTTEDKKGAKVDVHVGNKVSGSSGHQVGRGAIWLPANLNPITCTRQVTAVSPVLFQECGKGTPFPFAAIVRRKVVGGGQQNLHQQMRDQNSTHLMSFMRIDFSSVLLTAVSWSSDEDGVKETLSFVCDKAEVLYRQQTQTGGVGSKQIPPGIWQK